MQDFTAAAIELNLDGASNDNVVIAHVLDYLSASGSWLLVFDNVEDLALIKSLIPKERNGHVIVTTRIASTGQLAHDIEINSMTPSEGALLLLRRAKLLTAHQDLHEAAVPERELAERISHELGGLPLALDQAGAFIEEGASNLTEYLNLYVTHGKTLRASRGENAIDHESVTVTFSLAYEQLKKNNGVASKIIETLAFFAPDSIPENFIFEMPFCPKDQLARVQSLAIAHRYSLIRRNPNDSTLQVHRLVQAVISDILPPETKVEHAVNVVSMIERRFPEHEYTQWKMCRELMPHAIACTNVMTELKLNTVDGSKLLAHIAGYISERDSAEAETYARKAVEMAKVSGAEPIICATCMNNLGRLLTDKGNFDEAEPLHQEAMRIRKETLGRNTADVAISLNNLAKIFVKRKQLDRAERYLVKSIRILRKVKDDRRYLLARALSNLGEVYVSLKRNAEAQRPLKESMELTTELLGANHLDNAGVLELLSLIANRANNNELAVKQIIKALEIVDEAGERLHPMHFRLLERKRDLYQLMQDPLKALDTERELRKLSEEAGSRKTYRSKVILQKWM